MPVCRSKNRQNSRGRKQRHGHQKKNCCVQVKIGVECIHGQWAVIPTRGWQIDFQSWSEGAVLSAVPGMNMMPCGQKIKGKSTHSQGNRI